MPECEICGEDVTRVYVCNSCDTRFCTECGSSTEHLCIDCLDEDWEAEEAKEEES